jgi:hypothetical protein
MIATLRNFQDLFIRLSANPINKPMFIGDAPRPPSGKRAFEWFRFTETLMWASPDILN